MSKNTELRANLNKADLSKKAEERKKQEDAKCEYLGTIADKVLDAIESVFDETTPPPTGDDMIDVLSLVPLVVFARQIKIGCKDKKTMQSVMKSTMWALTNQINRYAEPFINGEEAWDDIAGEEGGNNGGTESKEL